MRELVRVAAPLERVRSRRCAPRWGSRGRPMRSARSRAAGCSPRATDRSTRWFAPTGLMRDVALASLPLADDDLRELHARAAGWYAAHGEPALALRSWRAIGDDAATARLLAEHGAALLREGSVEAVVEAGDAMPAARRDAALERLWARLTSCAATGTRRSRAWAARRAPRARSTPDWRGASASSTTCAGTSTRRSRPTGAGTRPPRAVERRGAAVCLARQRPLAARRRRRLSGPRHARARGGPGQRRGPRAGGGPHRAGHARGARGRSRRQRRPLPARPRPRRARRRRTADHPHPRQPRLAQPGGGRLRGRHRRARSRHPPRRPGRASGPSAPWR